jgi:hypothetical protein
MWVVLATILLPRLPGVLVHDVMAVAFAGVVVVVTKNVEVFFFQTPSLNLPGFG